MARPISSALVYESVSTSPREASRRTEMLSVSTSHPALWRTVAISVASSQRINHIVPAHRTAPRRVLSSLSLVRTGLRGAALHVSAKHPAVELAVATGRDVTRRHHHRDLTRRFDHFTFASPYAPRHRRVVTSLSPVGPHSAPMRLTLPRSTLQRNTPSRSCSQTREPSHRTHPRA